MMKNKFYTLERDGLTQGLLTMFQECRQKAKWFLEGWSPKESSFPLTFGTVGHAVLEQAYTKKFPSSVTSITAKIERIWRSEHKRATSRALQQLELALLIIEATMPIYFNYWRKDFTQLKWLQLEKDFNVPLNSVPMRGKRDGLYQLRSEVWLFESKFKGRVDEEPLISRLPFDLQTCLYMWTAWRDIGRIPAGAVYNIVRRTGLKQGAKENLKKYAKRVVDDIRSRPEFYFIRLEVPTCKADLMSWELSLNHMVEDFAAWQQGRLATYRCSHACSPAPGFTCPYLPLCSERQFSLFEKRERVFRELEEV
jgi:hypothetical protein